MNLYELTIQAQALAELIEEHAAANEGDISEVLPAIDEWAKEYDMERKLEGIAILTRNWEAQAEAQAKEAKRLADAAKTNENRAKRLKEWAIYCIQATGAKKANAGIFSFSVREASQAPLIVMAEAGSLPERFQVRKVEVKPDAKAIREALEAGDEEANRIAQIGQKSKFLVIK